jgi:hypothetical protein
LGHVIDQVSGSSQRGNATEQPLLNNPKPWKDYPSDEELKRNFKHRVIFIVLATVINSLMVIEPIFDPTNTTETLRYKLGALTYLIIFLSLLLVQGYVMIEGFVLYFKWRRLIIPPNNNVRLGEEGSA